MTNAHSVPVAVNVRSQVRPFALAGLVLGILFLTAFMRDIPLTQTAISNWRQEILSLYEPPQYAVCGCVSGSILFFMLLNFRRFTPRKIGFSDLAHLREHDAVWISNLLLFGILVSVLTRYALQYQQAASGTDALVFLSCLLLNQWLIWMLAAHGNDAARQLRRNFVTMFIVIGCFCLLLSPLNINPNVLYHSQFLYRGQVRWTGIWQNPNIFGLLMGVVFMLSAGRFRRCLRKVDDGHRLMYLIPLAVAATCLVKSYSRGAWVGTLLGAAFLFWKDWDWNSPGQGNAPPPERIGRKKQLFLWGMAGFVLGFLLVLAFKTAEQRQIPIVQRMSSAFGQKDFSSQNRLASYQDGIIMLMDHPFAGYGWDNVIAIHTAFYMQSGLSTGEAIKLNDFLMLALRLGLPTFAVFLLFVYVWLSAGRRRHATPKKPDGDILLCQTAALVLTVGFLFTDGLFRLACGGSFWLFLTLSLDFEAIGTRSGRIEDH